MTNAATALKMVQDALLAGRFVGDIDSTFFFAGAGVVITDVVAAILAAGSCDLLAGGRIAVAAVSPLGFPFTAVATVESTPRLTAVL